MHTNLVVLLYAGAIIIMLFVAAITCDANSESIEQQNYLNQLKQAYEQLEPIRIYGRVVDQDGNPLPDAEVTVSWQSATVLIGSPDYGRSDKVRSGHDGRWEFVFSKPHRAFVYDVCKEGYYSYRETKESSAQNLVAQPTSLESPVEITLRKKGEMTYLLYREGYKLIRVFSPQSQTNSLDILAKKDFWGGIKPYADLQVVASYDVGSQSWEISYTTSNDTDGIIASTNELYLAPVDGYEKQIVWNAPPWPRYLYMKSRTPTIYSRIELEHSVWTATETNQGFRISYEAWINPYGERNLEYNTDLGSVWRLREQLEEEALSALRDNRLPAKPDLPMRIRQAKEEAEKEDQ